MFDMNLVSTTCMSCFKQHKESVNPCPDCSYNEFSADQSPHLLRARTILNGKYLVGKVLGQGGFGITYIGLDINLGLRIALKEYYPSGFVTRETTSTSAATVQPFTGSEGEFFSKGREKFINEARALAKFFSLPGIVSVKDYFLENGTAYISMEFIDGQTLKDYIANMGGKLPSAQVFDLMKPVMSSLAEVHKNGIIHRDISPDNIMISKEGYLKLLDFGAARDFTGADAKSMSVMLKPGFAPEEQYRTKGEQGPWTDIYALSATMYRCITGITPEESVERVRRDNVLPPSAMGLTIDFKQENAMMMGMAVLQDKRFQSVPAIFSAMYGTPLPQSNVPSTVTGTQQNTQPAQSIPSPVTSIPGQYGAPPPPQVAMAPPPQGPPQYTPAPGQGLPQYAPAPVKSGSWLSNNKLAAGILGGVILLVLALGIVFLVMFLPGESGGVSISDTLTPTPTHTDTFTPAPSPTPDFTTMFHDTTWELYELDIFGTFLTREDLELANSIFMMWFYRNGDFSADFLEGGILHGTWRISGDLIYIDIDDTIDTLTLDDNMLSLTISGMEATFMQNDGVRFNPPDRIINTPPPPISDDDERQYHILKGTWVPTQRNPWLYHFGRSEKIIFFGDGRVYSSGDASDDYDDEIWSEWFIEGDVYDDRISVNPLHSYYNTFTFTIRGNTLILTDADGDSAEYERISFDNPVGRWTLDYTFQHMYFFDTSTTIEFDEFGIARSVDDGRWGYWWFESLNTESYTNTLVLWDIDSDITYYIGFFIIGNDLVLYDVDWEFSANYTRIG